MPGVSYGALTRPLTAYPWPLPPLMKVLRFLALLLPLTATAFGASAGPIDYQGNGSQMMTWTPYENVRVAFHFKIVEIHPEPTHVDGRIWQSPKGRPPHPPAASGPTVEITREYEWTRPNEPGQLTFSRRAESIDSRLVIQDWWTTKERVDAFVMNEIEIDLEKHPEATLTLMEPTDGSAPRDPRIATIFEHGRFMFTSSTSAPARGVEIHGVSGGRLRVMMPNPALISLQTGQRDTKLVRIRFLPLAIEQRIRSGEAVYTAEWFPAQ